ncbi:MAG: cupin domain-containing protein [Candidatus Riflebacteria bacterium]
MKNLLSYANLPEIIKHNVRGGIGEVRCRDYLKMEPDGLPFEAMGLNEMQPGATIPEHCHGDSAEMYYILSGKGTGIHNGSRFNVQPGDAWLCRRGETHGILNDLHENQVLSFISIYFAEKK